MSIIIQHEKRRVLILEKALDVFVESGFTDTTFQKIADRAGITRTILYTYFRNKHEIFNYSVKQLLTAVESDLVNVRKIKNLKSVEKLTRIVILIIERLEENRRLLYVIRDLLATAQCDKNSADYGIRRRTVKVRHILASMVIDGIKSGELQNVNVRTAVELLYSVIEAAIFRLAVLKRQSVASLKDAAALTIKQLATSDDKPEAG
ncbi:MAG: TetR/AcrR family transcriptional regulator [Spirochaetaceae bacterium]|jgi:AcrR family transcriptional regulator|nr:TetR/AcrR family transcriptional regulator [Spirochaetaceae bacterium]